MMVVGVETSRQQEELSINLDGDDNLGFVGERSNEISKGDVLDSLKPEQERG